jgi:hypothetical protein
LRGSEFEAGNANDRPKAVVEAHTDMGCALRNNNDGSEAESDHLSSIYAIKGLVKRSSAKARAMKRATNFEIGREPVHHSASGTGD